jgi:hypothetical protein
MIFPSSILLDEPRIRYIPEIKLVVPPPVFAFVLHDFQTEDYNYLPRPLYDPNDKLDDDKGWPEMCPLDPRVGVKLTERLQWFWVKQLVLSAYGVDVNNRDQFRARLSLNQQDYIENAWRGLTKSQTAFTNQRGTDTGRDYIRRLHPDADLPLLFENTCGGTVVELASRTVYSKGYKVKTLRTLDYEAWRSWTYKDHPQYFTKATVSTPTQLAPHLWRVDPFHYLDGEDVPVPIISDAGYVFVAPSRVRMLAQAEAWPRAYVP